MRGAPAGERKRGGREEEERRKREGREKEERRKRGEERSSFSTHDFLNPYTPSSVKRLVKEMTSPRNLTVDCDPRMGRYLSASALFRGEDLCTQEVDAALRWLQYKGSAEWAWVSIYSRHQGP